MRAANHRPPRFAERLLSLVTDYSITYSALGDFEEQFRYIFEHEGSLKANSWYWWQAIRSTPSFISDSIYWSLVMLKNYLITALRNLLKRKVHSFINIFGLSLGLAVSILIFLFVRNEFSYDRFHEHADSIFRIYKKQKTQQGNVTLASATSPLLAQGLKETFPEIENALRFGSSTVTIKKDELVFNEVVAFTDPDFFEVFSFPVTQGSRAKALSDPSSMVLSEEMAAKYFGRDNPIGKNLTVQLGDSSHVFVVTAVANTLRQNSSIVFDFLTRTDKFKAANPREWTTYRISFLETYVRLSKGGTASELERKLPSFVETVIAEGRAQWSNLEFLLQPLADIRLNTDIETTIARVSNPVYSYVLAGLGALVLLIACVNFITLSVGRSVSRAKEVGVRKVMGAFQSQIRKQYLGEALLTTTVALIAGLVLANLMLPTFNTLADKQLIFAPDLTVLAFLLALLFIVSFAAGSYPALVLARFQPVAVLKNVIKIGGKGHLSKSLVVLQFSLSILLIIGTLVIKSQVDYLREKNLGYDQERVVEISMNNPPNQTVASRTFDLFKNELMKDQRILTVSAALNQFGVPWTELGFRQSDGSSRNIFFNLVDYDYIKTLDLEIIRGRDFSHEFGTDYANGVVVNETLVKSLDWDDALNEQLPGRNFSASHNIIGVVRDFHYSSLRDEIKPLALTLNYAAIESGVTGLNTWNWPPLFNRVLVRIGAGKTAPILDFLKQAWHKVAPQTPFELTFLDETIQAQYAQENRWSTIINYSSIFAIAIACLGLFGLTMVAVERRVKEIGIRKVLGASVSGIVSIISKDLLVLVAAANIIAWPVAYFAVQEWLRNFAYRVDISVSAFIVASALAFLIALITISSQALKAALSNPIESLRTE